MTVRARRLWGPGYTINRRKKVTANDHMHDEYKFICRQKTKPKRIYFTGIELMNHFNGSLDHDPSKLKV